MTEPKERRIALFLDFENLVTNTGITPASFDLQPSLDRLLEKGKVVFRRAYCDWSRFHEAKSGLHQHGVDLIDVPPSTRAGKNAADMRLVIDALELCYAREHINTFVIASGDSDFCPLAYKLRENDRMVIGLGVKDSTSPLFVRACDEFIYLKPGERRGHREEHGRKGEGTKAHAKDGHRRGHERGEKREERGGEKAKKVEVPEIAREVVSRLLAGATGPLNPSLIKETIVRKEPDFDEREYGFSTFAKLLQAMEQQSLLKRVQHGRQWYVTPAEGGPEIAQAHPAEQEPDLEAIPDPEE